jgi:hypothetical protein
MTAIFTTIGSAADYGGLGRYVLLFFTLVCWIAQFASMVLTGELIVMSFRPPPDSDAGPSRWGTAMALYMISFISCELTLTPPCHVD